jgi:DNA-directed RNA polymerase specialized sigma24 family protein
MGPLARCEDHVRNVVTRLVAKVSEPSGSHLKKYREWQRRSPDKTFEDFTRIVVSNQVRDYVREVLGARPSENEPPSAKRLLNEFSLSTSPSELGLRPPYTAAETARELLEFARSQLDEQQWIALQVWLEGGSYDDVEARLTCPAGQGKRLVRSAVAVLRRHFGGSDEEIDLLA